MNASIYENSDGSNLLQHILTPCKNGGGGCVKNVGQRANIFFSLECFHFWWVGGGGMEQKVLFRAD